MTLRLTLERSPRPQAVRHMQLVEGELVIGRGAEAGWRIDDPDMFVSRAHCTIAVKRGQCIVTDTSSGGLFIDGSRTPLGMGNSTPLHDGARLQVGDYLIRVDMDVREAAPERPAAPVPAPAPAPVPAMPSSASGFERDSFFSTVNVPEPIVPRPGGLPDPFEQEGRGGYAPPKPEPRRTSPLFDDPFSLDPIPGAASDAAASTPPPRSPEAGNTGGNWDDFFSPQPAAPATGPAPAFPPQMAQPVPQQEPPPAGRQGTPGDDELLAAFLRGLGFRADEFQIQDPVARMESFGREYRLMVDGMLHLLRKRAEEKSEARVAQTIVGASEVNPLKFLPTVEDVMVTFLAQRQAGFLPPEAAITHAVRDLAQHHVQTWRGVQSALGRMLDRFDPAALEKELKTQSTWDALLGGGKRAKLWELYEKRYREIARSASTRFLGEIGSDFRDGYEARERD